MRLTCPSCGAQYEVPDEVIPLDGRDVQCSNCGTTWFQPHASTIAQDEPIPDPSELRRALTDLGDTTDPEEGTPAEDLPEQSPAAAQIKPERRDLDPEVKDILQEEAEHEQRLRAAASADLETQPDLGLDDTTDDVERRAREARARMDRLRGPQEDDTSIEEAVANATATATATATRSSRRDRLPDIDEINSSLRQSDAPTSGARDEGVDPLEVAPRKSGFARGFAIPLLIVAVLVLLYVNAAALSEAVPALGGALTSYVLFVDQLRVWLDAQISTFMP